MNEIFDISLKKLAGKYGIDPIDIEILWFTIIYLIISYFLI